MKEIKDLDDIECMMVGVGIAVLLVLYMFPVVLLMKIVDSSTLFGEKILIIVANIVIIPVIVFLTVKLKAILHKDYDDTWFSFDKFVWYFVACMFIACIVSTYGVYSLGLLTW